MAMLGGKAGKRIWVRKLFLGTLLSVEALPRGTPERQMSNAQITHYQTLLLDQPISDFVKLGHEPSHPAAR